MDVLQNIIDAENMYKDEDDLIVPSPKTIINAAVKLIHDSTMTIKDPNILKDIIHHLAEIIELAAMETP